MEINKVTTQAVDDEGKYVNSFESTWLKLDVNQTIFSYIYAD